MIFTDSTKKSCFSSMIVGVVLDVKKKKKEEECYLLVCDIVSMHMYN